MKKFLAILLLVSLGIFCLAALVMAEDTAPVAESNPAPAVGDSGVDLYLDYAIVNMIPWPNNQQANMLSIGMDYDKDLLVIGASYSTAVSFNPVFSDVTLYNYAVYGGYSVLKQDGASLAVIASYNSSAYKNPGGGTVTPSTIGIGLKGTVDFGSGNVSLLYSYGVSNKINYSTSGDLSGTTDAYYLELKGTYYFSDTVGAHAAYRSLYYKNPNMSSSGFDAMTFCGFSAGLDFKF